MPSGRAVRLSGWSYRSRNVVRRGFGRSVVPVSSPILDTCRRRRTLRQGSSEGNERAPAFHPGTWMHQCLQLALPAAGVIDVDSDPPRVGALVFKARNSSEQFRRFVGRVDGQQNRGASRVKRDNDAVSLGLPALPGRPRKLRTAVSAQKRQGQNPRLVQRGRPLRIVCQKSHCAKMAWPAIDSTGKQRCTKA
jgi:hypothetical protein